MKKNFVVNITEKLKKQINVCAETEEEAELKAEDLYNDSKCILTADDFENVEFSVCNLSYTEKKILEEIATFCENECNECKSCPEEDCILFRIEKIITRD